MLLHEAIAFAAEHGAKRLITVSPVGVERLLTCIDRQPNLRVGLKFVFCNYFLLAEKASCFYAKKTRSELKRSILINSRPYLINTNKGTVCGI